MKNTFDEKQCKCLAILEAAAPSGLCVAFSGGTDSSLLLRLARDAAAKAGAPLWAVTFDTVLHPSCDLEIASQVAAELGVRQEVIHMDELQNPKLKNNPPNRCYLCKKTLFQRLLLFAEEKGLGVVLEGTNEDDLHVYRPGLQAIRELGVISPLSEAGLSKEEIRSWAEELGISVASRPASPCLATRLPYGTEIDLSLLARIGACEESLRARGLGNVRVRVHGEILRLEVDTEAFGQLLNQREAILDELRKVGPAYLTLDLEGFRSGSMDLEKGLQEQPEEGPQEQPGKGPQEQLGKGPQETPEKGSQEQLGKGSQERLPKGPQEQPEKEPQEQPETDREKEESDTSHSTEMTEVNL